MQNEKIKPKILFLNVNNPGVVFYRMYQFAQKISEFNLAHCKMFPDWLPERLLMTDWEHHLDEYMSVLEELVKWADFVICQYINSHIGLSVVEAIRDLKPCYVEIDDYISQVPYTSIAYDTNKPGEAQDIWSKRQVIESHGVITTTEYLRDYYLRWNQNVKVIPNCIDFDLWDMYKSHSNEKVRIGWIGGANHDGDLKLIKNVLYEILDKYPQAEVYIVSYPPPEWKAYKNLHLINKWATIDKYSKMMKELSFDIGIAPLRDNYFNRGKSNLKYLEYSACHIPTVASNVESFKNGNFQGFLCNTDEEWFNSLATLIANQDLRLQMGWNGYYDVKENFNLNIIARRYFNFIQEKLEWQYGQMCHHQQHQLG